MWLIGWLACSGDPAPRAQVDPTGTPSDTELPVPVTPTVGLIEAIPRPCADPGARAQRAFERFEIPASVAPDHRFVGGGALVADLDGDGALDLLLPGPDEVRVLDNVAGQLVADPSAVPARDWSAGAGASAADVDGDGDLDVIVTRYGPPDVLLLNQGDGRFVDAGDPVIGVAGHSQSSAWADVDGDGDLDLAIAGHAYPDESAEQIVIDQPADPTRLFLNRGDGTFENATSWVPRRMRDAYTFVVTFSDLDGDGRPDLVQANDFPLWEPGLAALNRGDRFELAPPELGLEVPYAGMGLAAEDLDSDGRDDFLVPVWDQLVFLRHTAPFGVWFDASAAAGLHPLPPHLGVTVGWGAQFGDLDHDGDLDAVTIFGHLDSDSDVNPNGTVTANAAVQFDLVWEQTTPEAFVPTLRWGLVEGGVGRGVVLANLDGDGWLDVVRPDLGGPTRVDMSRCGDASWLIVRPEPLVRAVGARVEVQAGDLTVARTIRAGGTGLNTGGPPEAHFGLGDATRAERIEIRWPDGATTVVEDVDTDQILRIR